MSSEIGRLQRGLTLLEDRLGKDACLVVVSDETGYGGPEMGIGVTAHGVGEYDILGPRAGELEANGWRWSKLHNCWAFWI